MARPDLRRNDEMRKVKMTPGFCPYAEGSVLIEMGKTRVVCAATVEERVPPHVQGTGRGWVTAEYAMLPRATHTRNARDIGKLKLSPAARRSSGSSAARCAPSPIWPGWASGR